jgi:toxoflavin biosynthesis protein ToxD
MSEPVQIFVSYASPDRAFAERLVADLQAAGAEVWWDVSGIDEGDFLAKINQALQQCQWLVLVLTPNAVASKWVNIEVNAAINRRQQGFMQAVLPVLAAPIQPGTIPPVWDNLHRYDAVANYQGEVGRLLRTLGLSGAPAGSPHAAPAMPAAPPHVAPPDRFPPRLAELGYRVAFLNGAEVILPPLCDVPAGPFLMGSDLNKDKDADTSHELPQHWVTLGAYQITKHPVTVAEYVCFIRATNRATPIGEDGKKWEVSWQTQLRTRLDHPVGTVSWHDAAAYAQWLAEQTEQPWRLPSEAEWEKAARWDAATGTARIYPWGDSFDRRRCNSRESGKETTTTVGTYPSGASPCGALDMAGNVYEWTSSVSKPYPYNAIDRRERADSTELRVLRGGSWVAWSRFVRTAFRSHNQPERVSSDLGFRLVLAAPSS